MAAHGISTGDVSIDVAKMMENKASKVEGLTGGIEYLCKKYKVCRRSFMAVVYHQMGFNLNDRIIEQYTLSYPLL